MPKTTLILAGTFHARQYANNLHNQGIDVIASLKGGTNARGYHCPTHTGGFGGMDAMVQYLHDNNIDKVVDKSHRFAQNISHNAQNACAKAGIPYEFAKLAPWLKAQNDDWLSFYQNDALINELKKIKSRHIFLSIGAKHAKEFSDLSQYHQLTLRSVIPINIPNINNIIAKGPYTLKNEIELFTKNQIDILVCRNSGEPRSYTKVEAALALKLPIYMLECNDTNFSQS